jgi:glycosyltransferase involved in cell wall biosynthesis
VNKNLPAVSIIMPTFNRADVLAEAIDSALAQTHRDFELIIIDDGSTDGTPELISKYNDGRIRLIKAGQNRGAAAARNLGINSARYDLIAFLDSDDQWLPVFLETATEKMTRSDDKTGVVYSAFWYCRGKEEKIMPAGDIGLKEGDILPELVRKNFITLQASLVKRQCFDDCGLFDESMPCRHDWELFLRIAEKWHFSFVSEPLLLVHQSASSISTNYRFKIAGWLPVIEKHLQLFKKYPKTLAGHWLDIASAFDYLDNDDQFGRMRKLVFRALRTWPIVNKKYLHLFLASVLGRRMYLRYRRLKNRLLGGTN